MYNEAESSAELINERTEDRKDDAVNDGVKMQQIM